MGNGYGVSSTDVRKHATEVNSDIVSKVQKAADAGDQVKLGNEEAFGKLLVHLLPPVIEACVGDAVSGLKSAAKTGESIHQVLDAIGQSYEETDNAMAELLKKIEKDGLLRW